MSFDLNKLENKLDAALSNETSETLTKFLNDKRMSNETKQTAVDLLWFLIPESTQSFIEHQYGGYEQAKEMEKEQTLDFTRNAVRKILDEDRQNPFNLEQYYNKTYGGNK